MYFGYAAPDEQITRLVDDVVDNFTKHHIVVAENDRQEIVGTIHVAHLTATEVEFGVMVAEAYRGEGVSTLMMDYAMTWCQNRGLTHVYMHCLGHNKPIIHLVEKYGLEITKEYGDADARVTLPPINFYTLSKEVALRHRNALHENIRSFRRMMPV
jgi:RimJ/RimL family protein N-acetyltransferase